MDINNQGPRLCVEVVIKTEGGIVLEAHDNRWLIPGGAVLHGEMLAEAVKRVARENAGAEVIIEKVLGYIEYPEDTNVRGNGWSVGIAFQVKDTGGKLKGKIFKELPEEMIWEQREFLKDK